MENSNIRIKHRRQLANAVLAVMLFLGLFSIQVQPARAASVPRLVVATPTANSFVPDRIFVRVTVNSQVPIAETKATAGSMPAVSLTKQSPICVLSCEYTGWVDVSSLPWGDFTLTLDADDVDGISSAPLAIALKHNKTPVIHPDAPLPFEVADPNLAVNVSCTDDNPGTECSSLKLSINGKLLASGTNAILETVSAEQWLGQAATVQLSASDASGLTSTQSYPIYVEDVSNLTSISKEAGLVLDTDDSRTLLWNAYDHRLRIRHQDTNEVETLPLLVPEQTQLNVRLIPGGAMGSAFDATGFDLPDGYYRKGLDPLGKYSSFIWRNSQLQSLAADDIRVNGDWAAYHAPGGGLRELTLENTASGVAVSVGFTDRFDYTLDDQGTLVFGRAGKLFRFTDGAAAQITPNDGFTYRSPVMDGSVLLYARDDTSTNSSTLIIERDGAAADLAGASAVQGDYLTAGGWITYTVYTEAGQKQLWLRSPSGEDERLTPTSTADSHFVHFRMQAKPLTPTTPVSG